MTERKPWHRQDNTVEPDVIRAYIAQQQCWICGKGGWKALSGHLCKKHGLPASEVRELAYMFKGECLISPELSERFSQVALRKFGNKKYSFIRGELQPHRSMSRKGMDTSRERAKLIQPLSAESQKKKRRPHECGVCGKLMDTSKPRHCSPECASKAISESTKKSMTPERIAHFKSVRYRATADELSKRAKRYWEKVKSLPTEQQKAFYLSRTASRRVRVTQVCVLCGIEFEIIPSQIDKIVTCRSNKCSREIRERIRLKQIGRKHTAESIARMSVLHKERWRKRREGVNGR